MEESEYCDECKCELCGHLVKDNNTCTCIIIKLREESAERIRALISMGHPNECGEPYGRFDVMEECNRRGKQLFLDLGWPIGPDAIYKNKYTGSESTLKEELYHLIMERDRSKSFDEMFSINGWNVLEHAWPKILWNDSQMFNEYKSKLSYFKNDDVDDNDEKFQDDKLLSDDGFDEEQE